jgi:hypothetical protein
MAAPGKDVLMRRALLALLLASLVLGSTACGSETTAEPAPQDAVVLAASKTNEAGTYKVDTTASVEVGGQSVEMSGTGAFDAERQRGQMSLSTSAAGQDIDLQMVYALPFIYIRYPAGLVPGIPGGKEWVKLDLESLGRQAGFDLDQLMQTGQADPSQGLRYLRGVTELEQVGEEEVRGVATTHYRGTIDLRRLADEDPALRKTVEQLIDQTGVTRVPVEVWIDGENFVRRLRQSYEDAWAASGVTMDMTTTTEFYDFGTEVNVEEPPDEDVADLAELLGQT